MRRALIVLFAVIVVFLFGLDRIALLVAESQIASQVQKSQGLASHPGVSVRGFPFLTQVLGGHYREVDVTVHDVTRNGLTVDRVDVHAHGVSVPLGRVLSGAVREVPVDRAEAQVTLGFTHLDDYIRGQLGEVLQVSSDGDQLQLTGTLPFPPRMSVSVKAGIDVAGSSITLRPTGLDAALSNVPGAQRIRGRAEQFFTIRLPISQLPFGIRLQRATVTADSLTIAASASGLTLRAPSG
jgi:hypothetical protein